VLSNAQKTCRELFVHNENNDDDNKENNVTTIDVNALDEMVVKQMQS
jgi:hypothetical protein